MDPKYVGALDQGTTSTRFIIFDHDGQIVGSSQKQHRQIIPGNGYVEHNLNEIWDNAVFVIEKALRDSGISAESLATIGIANQRETTAVWNRETGEPLHNAIVWMDIRTSDICEKLAQQVGGLNGVRGKTGLPIVPYFSGTKMSWLMENVTKVREAVENGTGVFGTIDSWLMYKFSGCRRIHATDVTNASRTLLMNLEKLEWDEELCDLLQIPMKSLPKIVPSSGIALECEAPSCIAGVPLSGVLGDQQAALFGQNCFAPGEAKNTYGTGCFLLLNTGEDIVISRHGLISTVAYQLRNAPPCYAVEGSIAFGGAIVQWLQVNLNLIENAEEVEDLAKMVPDTDGVYFVTALNGLFAPYWRDDARGTLVGISNSSTKSHIARAALEAIGFQTVDVFEAMKKDSGLALSSLKVDGGASINTTLMQFQADILGIPVARPAVIETTALGAAFAAGLATGFWRDFDDLRECSKLGTKFVPQYTSEHRDLRMSKWKKAVKCSLNWAE